MFTHRHTPRLVATLVVLTTFVLASNSFAKRPKKKAKPVEAPVAEAPAELPAEATVAVEPPPPPKPGNVVVASDSDGLVAELAGALHGLKVGDNTYELQPGEHAIIVRDRANKEVATFKVMIESEKDARVTVVTKGQVVIAAAGDTAVQIDGKAQTAKDGTVAATVAAGKHSIVITSPGRVGRSSDIDVVAGKTHSVTAALEAYDAGSRPAAWAGIIGGGALILTAVLVESFADVSALGGDATRWALVGVGTAGFVGGTILMKGILEREANPPIKPGTLDIKVSATPTLRGAALAMRF